MDPSAARIAENLACVRQRIADAAKASGRTAQCVRLVAVTKYVKASIARELVVAGCHDLGESRPQQLWEKCESLADLPVNWHLIGPLQRNKIQRTLPHVALIHSLDSARLLAAVNADAESQRITARGLLEVNVSGDLAKHGWQPADLPALLPSLPAYPRIKIIGLMTMARLQGGRTAAREDFARLRQLQETLVPLCPADVTLHELSMGMSGDFEEAIAEGATMIRVGSALFEGLDE